MLAVQNSTKSTKWILGSGLRSHIRNNRDNFVNLTSYDGVELVGNNNTLQSFNYGDINVESEVNCEDHRITPEHVLFSPDVMYNLISLYQVRENVFCIYDDYDNCSPQRGLMQIHQKANGEIKMIGLERPQGLYEAVLYLPRAEKAYITKQRTNVD